MQKNLLTEFLQKSKVVTPRKQRAPKNRGINLDVKETCRRRLFEQMKKKIDNLKKDRTDRGREKRYTIVASLLVKRKYKLLAKDLNLRPGYISNVAKRSATEELCKYRKRRSDGTCLGVIASIEEAYRSGNISREMPTSVKTDMKPRRVMEISTARAYELWKKDHQGKNVSLSTFRKLRPSDVLLLRRHRLNQCLCEYCTDIMLKLQTLSKLLLNSHGIDAVVHGFKDKYGLLASTMCPPETPNDKYSNMKCINRSCEKCGFKLLKSKLQPLLEDSSKSITWEKWQDISYEHNGVKKSKTQILPKSGSVAEFVDELLRETSFLAKHLFDANWQQDMFSKICKSPPEESVVMVLDFAENYSTFYQDEIQKSHWAKNQITVHPIVVYYKCNNVDDQHESHIVQEAVVVISSDLKHDGHAVNHFITITLDYLRKKRNLTINRVIEFSDGCACQYKSKLPFCDLSFSQIDIQAKRERHFFGSRHGKGPSDGVSGVVKSAVRRAVVARETVVDTAAKMFHYCSEQLVRNCCRKQRRVFLYVSEKDINRDRPDRDVKAPVPGTRILHAVRGEEPGLISVRMLSCFCDGCENDNTCRNKAYTIPWQKREIRLHHPPPSPKKCDQQPPPRPILPDSDIENPDLSLTDIWKSLTSSDEHLDPDLGPMDISGLSGILDVKMPDDVHVCDLQEDISPQNLEPDYRLGQFVESYLHSETKKRRLYMAEIKEISGGEYLLQFMEEAGKGLYFWPTTDDFSWEPKQSIHRCLSAPSLSKKSSSRRQFFEFNDVL